MCSSAVWTCFNLKCHCCHLFSSYENSGLYLHQIALISGVQISWDIQYKLQALFKIWDLNCRFKYFCFLICIWRIRKLNLCFKKNKYLKFLFFFCKSSRTWNTCWKEAGAITYSEDVSSLRKTAKHCDTDKN